MISVSPIHTLNELPEAWVILKRETLGLETIHRILGSKDRGGGLKGAE